MGIKLDLKMRKSYDEYTKTSQWMRKVLEENVYNIKYTFMFYTNTSGIHCIVNQYRLSQKYIQSTNFHFFWNKTRFVFRKT